MIRPFHRRFCLLLLALAALAGCGKVDPDAGTDGGKTNFDKNLVEPMPTDPRAELSNLRFGRGVTGLEKYSVDWRWTKKGPNEMDMQLFIKSPNRVPIKVHVSASGKMSGTVSGEILTNRPAGESPSLESGCEMYLALDRGLVFKISNSLTSGNASVTPPRPLTPEEIKRLTPQ
jgi:hypothetical protein